MYVERGTAMFRSEETTFANIAGKEALGRHVFSIAGNEKTAVLGGTIVGVINDGMVMCGVSEF